MTYSSVKKIDIFMRFLLPAVVVVAIFYFYQNPWLYENAVMPSTLATSTVSSAAIINNPTILIIPSINLKANIQHVGRTWSGSMAVPTNFTDVGWYDYGATPGAVGSAVIDGHVDNALGLRAVFANLNKLSPGDMIYVQDASGTQATFKVTGTQIYEYNHAPLEKIFGATSTKALNLITCSGTWISADKTDSHRLVIYTEAVSS
jgi:sortase A